MSLGREDKRARLTREVVRGGTHNIRRAAHATTEAHTRTRAQDLEIYAFCSLSSSFDAGGCGLDARVSFIQRARLRRQQRALRRVALR